MQDEITENKRKLKIMNHQIDQLKEEIQTKESALVKEQLEHQRVEKEKETLKVSGALLSGNHGHHWLDDAIFDESERKKRGGGAQTERENMRIRTVYCSRPSRPCQIGRWGMHDYVHWR